MYLAQIGALVRAERQHRGLTQAELAELAGLTRETINRLEHGAAGDLGAAKLGTLLAVLGLELAVRPRERRGPDHVLRATTSANVSQRERLQADELVHALVTGRPRAAKRALVRAALAETSPATRAGLVEEVGAMVGHRARVERAIALLVPRAG